MKQTAVEWLLNEFQELHKNYGGLDLDWLKRFKQAKEMEKEQIIDAYNQGCLDTLKDGMKRGEQYYNETFKNKQNETN